MWQSRLTLVLLFLIFSPLSFAAQIFPENPDPELTPGSLCKNPTEFRYAERIPYCKRNVNSQRKDAVVKEYNQKRLYAVPRADRREFKIDHMVPLCAGGSNEADNLWPQHQQVYAVTDWLEGEACRLLQAGRLRQREAIAYVVRAKLNLNEAPAIEAELRAKR